MYLCKIFSVFFILCNSLLFAQKVIVVCNSENKTPIANVNIFTKNFNLITNEKGLAEIPKSFSNDSICFSHVAYIKTCILYNELPDTVLLFTKNLITDEITVSANVEKTDNISTINISKIKKSSFNNVGDLLKSESSFFIKDYGGIGGVKSISTRGLSSENTVVLFNDARINDMKTGMFDFSLISPTAIDYIQISKNSSENGHISSGGIVKLFSGFDNLEDRFLLGIKGNTDFYRSLFFNLKKNYNGFSLAVNFERSYSSNNYKYKFLNTEFRRNNAFFSKTFFSFNIEHRTKSNIFNFYSHYNFLKNGIPGFVVTNNTKSSFAFNQSKMYFFVLNNNYLISQNWSLLNNLSYNYQSLLLNDPLKQIFSNKSQQNSILKEAAGFIKGRYSSNNFIFVLGYDFNYTNLKNDLPTENDIILNINRFSNKLFVNTSYSITSLTYFKDINFSGAVSYDNYTEKLIKDNQNKLISYRLGASLKPNVLTNFTLSGYFSKSLRSPSFNEQFYSSLYNLKFLNNEYYEGYDIILSYGNNPKNNFSFSLTYYDLISKDKIVWIPSRQALQTPKNYGHIRFKGIEFYTNLLLFDEFFNIDIYYNYNLALSKSKMFAGDNSYNKQLVYIPKERLNINTTINFKNLTLKVYNSFVGERFYSSDNDPNNRLAPYYLCDAVLSYSFNAFDVKNTITLSVFNIFNKDYFVIQSYPMPLRNYSITYITEIL